MVPSASAATATAIVAIAPVIAATIKSVLFLRRQVAVWIAHAVTGTQIPAVPARRRPSWHAILDLLHGGLKVRGRQGRPHE